MLESVSQTFSLVCSESSSGVLFQSQQKLKSFHWFPIPPCTPLTSSPAVSLLSFPSHWPSCLRAFVSTGSLCLLSFRSLLKVHFWVGFLHWEPCGCDLTLPSPASTLALLFSFSALCFPVPLSTLTCYFLRIACLSELEWLLHTDREFCSFSSFLDP